MHKIQSSIFSRLVLAALATAVLSGCAAGITGIELDPFSTTVCDRTGQICGIADDAHQSFRIIGHGSCGTAGVKFGDGEETTRDADFARTASHTWVDVEHQYTQQHPLGPRAWPGPKTVHAYSASNCVGEARMRVNILLKKTDTSGTVFFSPTFAVGLEQPTAMACNVPSNTRPLRAGAKVLVTEVPGGPQIDFGCLLSGCINHTGGNAGPVDASFPFGTMRRHSLVLRIVGATRTQLIQGSPRTEFTVDQAGPLEFCVNDNVLTDNSGAWGMEVLVDETNIP